MLSKDEGSSGFLSEGDSGSPTGGAGVPRNDHDVVRMATDMPGDGGELRTRLKVSQDLILDICRGLDLPPKGYAYVEQALRQPQRLVLANCRGVTDRFASEKMRQVIQSESATGELPFIHRLELDPAVLGFLDQPPKLYYETVDRRGRMRPETTTPDLLVIRRSGVTIVECKPGTCGATSSTWRRRRTTSC